MKRTIHIGMFGLGTVAQGVLTQLEENKHLLEDALGAHLVLRKVVVHNLKKTREWDTSALMLSDDPEYILADPQIDLVIEVMGGVDTAFVCLQRCMESQKGFITANKALLAEQGSQIEALLAKTPVPIAFEAAVGGGIPVINALQSGVLGNRIDELSGILNGTSNYILSAMLKERKDFDDILAEAQAKGYSEADPSFDIDGIDAAHKLVVLARVGFGKRLDLADLHIQGIRQVQLVDLQLAADLGYALRHVAAFGLDANGAYHASVGPVLLESTHTFAGVEQTDNAVRIQGNFCGPITLIGAGAGGRQTASSILADLLRMAAWNKESAVSPQFFPVATPVEIKPASGAEQHLILVDCSSHQAAAELGKKLGQYTAQCHTKQHSAALLTKPLSPADFEGLLRSLPLQEQLVSAPRVYRLFGGSK